MEDLPTLQIGFTRLAVLLDRPQGITPGVIASRIGVDLDHLGPVLVMDNQCLVDVANDYANRARTGLEDLGPVQEIGRKERPITFQWLRLSVGRNHGLTLAHLRKVLERTNPGPLGRIHVNNTHSTIGLRDDVIDSVIEQLKDIKVNGAAAKPERVPDGEIYESAEFKRKAQD